MAGRRLTPEEQALWQAVAGTIRPIRPGLRQPPMPEPASQPAVPDAKTWLTNAPHHSVPAPRRAPVDTLDASWERRIRGGALVPDLSIDLHGHSLSAAHMRLNEAIATAVARGARVLLVVTGKPRKSEDQADGKRRGAIRAEIGHWLGRGAHADRIASVRVAHPRHGGDGALYIILRARK
ncbi:MAG: Smr/MutS family protein [Sphingobium sp.]